MKLPPGAPWAPFPWEGHKPACYALQALAEGRAEPEQQKLALKLIIEGIAGTYDEHFIPAGARETDYALGKAHVGRQIVKILKLNLSRIKEVR
jgi:hypothetical protein